jgi:hypothetical protein
MRMLKVKWTAEQAEIVSIGVCGAHSNEVLGRPVDEGPRNYDDVRAEIHHMCTPQHSLRTKTGHSLKRIYDMATFTVVTMQIAGRPGCLFTCHLVPAVSSDQRFRACAS